MLMDILNSAKNAFRLHQESLKHFAAATPWWVLILPLLFGILLYYLDQTFVSAYLDKDSAEFAAPLVLGMAFLISLLELKKPSHTYYYWQAFFAFILFMRELHFYGTNNGFYIGFLLMAWWASRYRQRLEPYISQRLIMGFLVSIIWVYLVSKTFDRHLWDNFLPQGVSSDLFEENLELIGHLLFLSLVSVTFNMKPGRKQV
jgi:hypothetical protein